MRKLLVFSLFIVGCGVQPTNVKKDGLKVAGIRRFDVATGEKLRFPSVTMFLWKNGFTGDDVKTVNQMSYVIAMKNAEGVALTEKKTQKLEPLEDEKKVLRREQKKLEKELSAQLKKVDAAKSAWDAEPANENLKAVYEQEMAKYVQMKESSDGRLAEITTRLVEIDAEMEKHMADFAKEDERIRKESGDALRLLQSRVDWFETQPAQVMLDFEKDSFNPTVKIEGWDPYDGRGKRTFTTEIKPAQPELVEPNVAYESIGKNGTNIYEPVAGKVRFYVYLDNGYSYEVNLLRSDSSNMSGDIVLRREGESPRYGIIKLSDSKN